jgi:hypothetical protein
VSVSPLTARRSAARSNGALPSGISICWWALNVKLQSTLGKPSSSEGSRQVRIFLGLLPISQRPSDFWVGTCGTRSRACLQRVRIG